MNELEKRFEAYDNVALIKVFESEEEGSEAAIAAKKEMQKREITAKDIAQAQKELAIEREKK
ncbi:hypothetical protein ACFSTE_08885 [Aquimarina hainanensis]|uniref:Uncharacterized protein n=1 Tax=Aquimarina hainanensis TaxID=1578017 RepID=A0ABW5N8K3_9FLAO|nr:hypothetical protein [Aquimarina sp. TRL1]QKX03896.1 hypothetical protein HN014_02900 [Aquimarina sp. TRL1]